MLPLLPRAWLSWLLPFQFLEEKDTFVLDFLTCTFWGLWKEVWTDQRAPVFTFGSAHPEQFSLSLPASVSLRSVKCLGMALDFPLGVKLCSPFQFFRNSREENNLETDKDTTRPPSVGNCKDTQPRACKH